MPLSRDGNGQLRLLCASHAACIVHAEEPSTASTMRAIVGFWALLEIKAPVPDANGRIGNLALPARAFRCEVCGYLELYDAAKTA